MIIPYIWENKIDVPNHQPVVKANVKLTMKIYLRVSYITGDIPKACSETDFPIDGQITAGFFHWFRHVAMGHYHMQLVSGSTPKLEHEFQRLVSTSFTYLHINIYS